MGLSIQISSSTIDLMAKLVLCDQAKKASRFWRRLSSCTDYPYDDSSYNSIAYGVVVSGISYNEEIQNWEIECRAHYKARFDCPEEILITDDLCEQLADVFPDGTHHDEMNKWLFQDSFGFKVELENPEETVRKIVEKCSSEMEGVSKTVENARKAFSEISELETEDEEEENKDVE